MSDKDLEKPKPKDDGGDIHHLENAQGEVLKQMMDHSNQVSNPVPAEAQEMPPMTDPYNTQPEGYIDPDSHDLH